MPLHTKSTPLTATEIQGDYNAALAGTQANILKSHGRDYAAHVFVTFTDPNTQRAKLGPLLAAESPTSALEQYQQTRDDPHGEKIIRTVSLSWNGYQALGITGDYFTFPAPFKRGFLYAAPSDGQADAVAPSQAHALITLAHDDPTTPQQEVDRLAQTFNGIAIIHPEFGAVLKDASRNVREHFGFVDGISQPEFFASDIPRAWSTWNPAAGPVLALVREPFTQDDPGCGSFLTFIKIEQDVAGFQRAARNLADSLVAGTQATPESALELAMAYIIGRFRNGAPLPLQGAPDPLPASLNDFDYSKDASGSRCPLSAHARKTNPRDTEGSDRRMARRGITYGDPYVQDETPPKSRGILFQSYQASLTSFEFVLARWINNPDHPLAGTGVDPLLGQGGPAQKFSRAWDESDQCACQFSTFTRTVGGQYFYTPSIRFLNGLA